MEKMEKMGEIVTGDEMVYSLSDWVSYSKFA